MPIYKLQAPDGKVYTIEGPEGATAEQLGAFITAQDPKQQRLAQAKAENDKFMASINPTDGMSGFEKFAAGAGKAIHDTGQGLGQLVGLTSRADVEETRKRDAPLMNSGAGMAGNIAGNIGMFLAPGGAAMGAGKVLSKAPQAAKLAEALTAGGKAIIAPSGIPQAAAVGAAQGLVQPSTSTSETLMNGGIGGAASAAMPLLVRGGQVAKAALDPFSEEGQRRVIGRAMNTAAGNDAPAALQNLRSATELVPGSAPTAGQAAGNPGIAALERTATAIDPVAMNEMGRRTALQNDARIEAVQKIAGTPATRQAAVEARDDAAQVAYGRARQSDEMRRSLAIDQQQAADAKGIGIASLANMPKRTQEESARLAVRPSSALEDLTKRPDFKGYIESAKRLAANKGQDIGNPLESVDGLHYIKLAIDDALSGANPTQALGRNAKAATMDMKERLVKEIDAISPAYAVSREAYQKASRPINQMELAAQLLKPTSEGGALNPVRGNMTPAAYARLLKDDTAANVTNFKGATLANTMEPQQLATLNAVKDDLARADFAQTAGRGVGSDTVQKLAYSNLMDTSGLPNLVRSIPGMGTVGGIAQRVADAGYGRANKEMSSKLAQALLNPQDAAALMEAGVSTPGMHALIEGLRRGGAGLGAASPYLLNATKE